MAEQQNVQALTEEYQKLEQGLPEFFRRLYG